MIPKHGDIFMYRLLKQKLHELLTDGSKLLPVNPIQPANAANRSSFYTLDESSDGEKEETYEVPTQGA
jgi:hypothetical protein